MELGNSKQEIDVPQNISDTDNMDNYNDDDTNVKLFQLPTEIIQHIVSYLSLQGMDKIFLYSQHTVALHFFFFIRTFGND